MADKLSPNEVVKFEDENSKHKPLYQELKKKMLEKNIIFQASSQLKKIQEEAIKQDDPSFEEKEQLGEIKKADFLISLDFQETITPKIWKKKTSQKLEITMNEIKSGTTIITNNYNHFSPGGLNIFQFFIISSLILFGFTILNKKLKGYYATPILGVLLFIEGLFTYWHFFV